MSRATRRLLEVDAEPGLYHCVNAGACSWDEFAREAARLLGCDARLKPITLDSVSLRAPRPRYSALATPKLENLGIEMPPWQDALRSAHRRARRSTVTVVVLLPERFVHERRHHRANRQTRGETGRVDAGSLIKPGTRASCAM